MMDDLAGWIDHGTERYPDRVAIHFDDRDIAYCHLQDRIHWLAGFLRDGCNLGSGDRIAYLGYNHPDLIALTFACSRIGTIHVPLNWRLTASEIMAILYDCQPRLLLCAPEFADLGEAVALAATTTLVPLLQSSEPWFRIVRPSGTIQPSSPLRAPKDERPLLLMYTSGTTGTPKGALLTQEGMWWNALNAVAGQGIVQTDNVLTNLPLFHVGGLAIQTLPALYAGATITLQSRFDADATLHIIEARRPTIGLAVATTMRAMVEHPRWRSTDLSSLRVLMTGASIIPESLLLTFAESGVPASQVYGATEMGPIAACLHPDDALRKLGSIGLPAPHRTLRLIDADGMPTPPKESGEIVVNGPGLMVGYWNDPIATSSVLKDGSFHTGDIGRVDEDGFYFIIGRKKETIISGGENIYPAEIENILCACPEVEEAAVVGRPDRNWVEVPIAFVVKRSGCDISADGLRQRLDGRVARYKQPRDYVFVDKLPRNALGKLVRSELRRYADPGNAAAVRTESSDAS